MVSHIYKVCPRVEWVEAQKEGAFTGSAVDVADGFIHFSTADQLSETLRRHFKDQMDLVALVVPVAALADGDLKWEPSRGGALFPHLYGPLPSSAVEASYPLEISADGIPFMPKGALDE